MTSKAVFISLLLMLFGASYAQEYKKLSDSQACRAAIVKKQQSLKSLSADFKETTHSEMLANPQQAKGLFLFKKDEKVRWEHSEPKKQIILINGETVRLSENGKEQSNPGSLSSVRRIQGLMLDMLSGDFLSSKAFRIDYYENQSSYKLVLNPTSERMRKYIRHITLVFDKTELYLNEMTISESDSDKVVYVFSNIRQDVSIDDSKFTQF